MISIRDRYRGTLLGLAVGNALGLQVEGWSRDMIRRKHRSGIREIVPDEVTLPWDDDLAQAVILAEAILEHDTMGNDDLARRLLQWADSNGRGMGSQTRAVINALRHGMKPSQAAKLVWEVDRGQPAGNGAVMRCAPVAMRWPTDRKKLLEETERSAAITHYDPRCAWSAFAVNLAVAEALHGRTASIDAIAGTLEASGVHANTLDSVRSVAGRPLEKLQLEGPTMGFTLKAMQVGLWCLEHLENLEESLVSVVEAGGDTDTNGAVAGAILGALHGAEAIPVRWTARIRNADQLVSLADRLLERATEAGEIAVAVPK